MSKRIIAFNIIYYAVIFALVMLGQKDPSSSLGYGYFIMIFWIISAVVLLFLLKKRIIQPRSVLDWIGVVAATPLLCIVIVMIILSRDPDAKRDFNGNNYYYEENTKVKDITAIDSIEVR